MSRVIYFVLFLYYKEIKALAFHYNNNDIYYYYYYYYYYCSRTGHIFVSFVH